MAGQIPVGIKHLDKINPFIDNFDTIKLFGFSVQPGRLGTAGKVLSWKTCL